MAQFVLDLFRDQECIFLDYLMQRTGRPRYDVKHCGSGHAWLTSSSSARMMRARLASSASDPTASPSLATGMLTKLKMSSQKQSPATVKAGVRTEGEAAGGDPLGLLADQAVGVAAGLLVNAAEPVVHRLAELDAAARPGCARQTDQPS